MSFQFNPCNMQKFLLQPGHLPSLSAQLISQQVCLASLSSEPQPTKQPSQPKSVFLPQPTWQPLMLSFSGNHQKSLLPPPAHSLFPSLFGFVRRKSITPPQHCSSDDVAARRVATARLPRHHQPPPSVPISPETLPSISARLPNLTGDASVHAAG